LDIKSSAKLWHWIAICHTFHRSLTVNVKKHDSQKHEVIETTNCPLIQKGFNLRVWISQLMPVPMYISFSRYSVLCSL